MAKKKVSKLNNTKIRHSQKKGNNNPYPLKKVSLIKTFKKFYTKRKEYVKPDIRLHKETYWMDGRQWVKGFCFYIKSPYSKSYQYHATITLDYLEKISSLIQKGQKKKTGVDIRLKDGMGYEEIAIPYELLDMAEQQLNELLILKQEQDVMIATIYKEGLNEKYQ